MRKIRLLLLAVVATLTMLGSTQPASAVCTIYTEEFGCLNNVVCKAVPKADCMQ